MQISYTTGQKKDHLTGYKTLGVFFGRMLLIIGLTILAMLFGTPNSSAQQDADETAKSPELKIRVESVPVGKQAVSSVNGSLMKAL